MSDPVFSDDDRMRIQRGLGYVFSRGAICHAIRNAETTTTTPEDEPGAASYPNPLSPENNAPVGPDAGQMRSPESNTPVEPDASPPPARGVLTPARIAEAAEDENSGLDDLWCSTDEDSAMRTLARVAGGPVDEDQVREVAPQLLDVVFVPMNDIGKYVNDWLVSWLAEMGEDRLSRDSVCTILTEFAGVHGRTRMADLVTDANMRALLTDESPAYYANELLEAAVRGSSLRLLRVITSLGPRTCYPTDFGAAAELAEFIDGGDKKAITNELCMFIALCRTIEREPPLSGAEFMRRLFERECVGAPSTGA